MTHSFKIRCVPPKSTAQAGLRIITPSDKSKKPFIGKFKDSKAKKTEGELMLLLERYMPPEPFVGPVHVSVTWAYPWRKSESKKAKADGWKPCDTRPDIDNLCKMLFDCMSRLNFWNDDAQVSDLNFSKMWSDEPGISISIQEQGTW